MHSWQRSLKLGGEEKVMGKDKPAFIKNPSEAASRAGQARFN